MSSYGHYGDDGGPISSPEKQEKKESEMHTVPQTIKNMEDLAAKKNEQWKRAMGLKTVQAEAWLWLLRNFPTTTPEEQFLGVVEEVGELSHAILKNKQGIRQNSKVTDDDMKDAVGDIMIYLINYCNMMDWDLMEIVQDVWVDEVNKRDWIKYPVNGLDK